MNKWDKRFMDLADLVASWSKDPSSKVGAVIVDDCNRIISVGYNGPPRKVSEVDMATREVRLARTIHAEVNAMNFANRDLSGCMIYVTHPPCANCAAQIIQRGITTVAFRPGTFEFMQRWKDNYDEAISMFLEADVKVAHL